MVKFHSVHAKWGFVVVFIIDNIPKVYMHPTSLIFWHVIETENVHTFLITRNFWFQTGSCTLKDYYNLDNSSKNGDVVDENAELIESNRVHEKEWWIKKRKKQRELEKK